MGYFQSTSSQTNKNNKQKKNKMKLISKQEMLNYQNPSIIEERPMNITQLDIFSRLMMDRIIFLGSEVNDTMSNIIVSQLLFLENQDPGKEITLYVNSPGGSVYSGYGIIDTMNYISSPVKTVCTGLAASMGAMILMCGEKGRRFALPHARVMIHQPLSGMQGQASDLEIAARETVRVKDELYKIIQEQTGQDMDKIIKDADRDYWMTSQESLDYGIIDGIVRKTTEGSK